jgi:hypothetical protein
MGKPWCCSHEKGNKRFQDLEIQHHEASAEETLVGQEIWA